MNKVGALRIWLKKNVKYCCVYFCIVALLVGALVFANRIIMDILGEVHTAQFETYATNASAASSVNVEFLGGIKEAVKISGWAFCDTTEETRGEKEIYLLLKSDRNCYVVSTTLGRRADVYEAFYETHDIVGTGHGFTAQFSTIGIKNGLYQVLVYCKENNCTSGIADPNIQMEKDNKNVIFYTTDNASHTEMASQAISGDFLQEIDSSRNSSSFIDQMEVRDAVVSISGWAFLENFNCEKQKVYIKLTNGAEENLYFEARKMLRTDVGNHFNNSDYDMSGFIVDISKSDMSDGKYSLQIITWIDAETYGCAQYSVSKEENEIHYGA